MNLTARLTSARRRSRTRSGRRLRAYVGALPVVVLGLAALPGTPTASSVSSPGVATHQHTSFGVDEVNSDCSTDVSASLNALFAAATKGSEITLAHDGCYLADEPIVLSQLDGVWLNGNGATIRQPSYAGDNVVTPILRLTSDTDIAVTDLVLNGPALPGGDGNEYTEGDYGILMQGDVGVSINTVTVENVQGDFVALYSGKDGALDQNISVTNSTFSNAGYHGVTIESVNGVTFADDTFNTVVCDGVDLEYDIYPTTFVNGQPTGGAEDNVTFEDTQWSHVGCLWLASYQGQEVQENNLALIDNTLTGIGMTIGIIGNQQVPNSGLLVEGNDATGTATGVWGGSSAPIWLTYVNNVDIGDNDLVYSQGSYSRPFLPAMQLLGTDGATVEQNVFDGALSPIEVDGFDPFTGSMWSGTPSQDVTECGDAYGVNGQESSPACPP